jgi:two-component system sensor histidine kinase KdpD
VLVQPDRWKCDGWRSAKDYSAFPFRCTGYSDSVSDETRPSPDALLAAIQKEDARKKRGKLKVFFGMAPGVGKTYAMLEAARRELAAGRDVVIGYVETHGRKETDALTMSLPLVPRRIVEYRGVTLTEMDLDAVLARRPQLALVDELAHTNAPESRHPKRWQDVRELLDAGIDVFTTLNVQHVESRADTVRQITTAEIRETVPDSMLDNAAIELVDLPPPELLQRLQEGKVYVPDRAAAAAGNFFRESNLTALRELALRLVADHVGEHTRHWRRTQTGAGPWKTGHCLLVAVGPSPASASLIRWTRQMADSLQCRWLAVHVEGTRPLADWAQAQLTKNLASARELGAEVVMTTDEDLVQGLLRVAREQNATQVIVGKPGATDWFGWLRAGWLLRRLIRESGDIDIQVVRAEKRSAGPARPDWRPPLTSNFNQYWLVAAVITGTAAVNLLLERLVGPRVPGTVFLLAVVLLALFVGRGPVLVAGALSALCWDFFFLPPRFTFAIEKAEDAVLFGTYFVVAVVLGQLVARIRAQREAERQREERATALFELMRDLANAGSHDEVVWYLIAQVTRVFNAPAAVCLPTAQKLAAHPDSTLALSAKEVGVAQWAFDQRKAAGRFTDNLPGADALHLPLMTEHKTLGVLAVSPAEKSLSVTQRELLETFASQASLVLDRVELRAAATQASLIAESERLGKTLLNSVSHELRTPLAAITSAVSGLREAGPLTDVQQTLAGELEEAVARLDRLVRNLLDLSRLEAGHLRANPDWHDLHDVVRSAMDHLGRALAQHPVKLDISPDLPPVRLDFVLTEQILANLLGNAARHTPPGTAVEFRARTEPGWLMLEVADRGSGLPPGDPARLFDRFQRGPGATAGGTGLGLSLVKGFTEAQGGTVTAANRPDGGAVFTVRLPLAALPPVPEDKE